MSTAGDTTQERKEHTGVKANTQEGGEQQPERDTEHGCKDYADEPALASVAA